MMNLLLIVLLPFVLAAPENDRMKTVPGYPKDFPTAVYTGYLDLGTPDRAAHYVFVQSLQGDRNTDPLTLWLNGGPGCSSLIGFLQEIGPYYLAEGANYKYGDNLTRNPYSWHNASNLLFLESPAGVGYSYNNDVKYVNTDANTAEDNMKALLDFFKKFPEFVGRRFWLAGESYAGKYIPDLAVLIDKYNQDASVKINLKGVFIGNGIMSFDAIGYAEVNYMLDRSFVNPDTINYWRSSCQFDPDSAGCRFFSIQFQQDIDEINPYNVYGYCYYNDHFTTQKRRYLSQESILTGIKRKFALANNSIEYRLREELKAKEGYNAAPCSYFDGMHNYFNLHEFDYKAKYQGQKWNGPCAQNITYHVDPRGSIESYRYLLGRILENKYQIHLYNGNWDVVVPYHDTVENIRRLDLVESYLYTPWFTEDQHSGFQQIYSGIILSIVKGASHMVPMSKRPQAFNLFNATLDGHKE